MTKDRPTSFNRTGLNILILVCIVFILFFGQASQDNGQIDLPPAPVLSTHIWQTDSAANVWFNPKLDEHIYIELHYLAGFSFNQAPFASGTSALLVSLLNHQARSLKLPFHSKLSPDFIEISIRLNTDALIMKNQIKALSALLYRPKLDAAILNAAKDIIPSALDALWQQAYSNHAYQGPKSGTADTVATLHRAAIQQFQQRFLHPARLSASITGDLNEQAAQIIMESLLPNSPHTANTKMVHPTKATGVYQHNNMAIVVLPGSYEQAAALVNQRMLLNILHQLNPNKIPLVSANANNSILIENWPQTLNALNTPLTADVLRKAKRKSIKDMITRTQTASSLSQLLVHLNRYHLPSSFIQSQFSMVKQWQKKDWQAAIKPLIEPSNL